MCLYDFLYSAWNTNFYSLYPDKFRSHKERTRVAGISTAIGQLGMALGLILPPLLIDYGDQSSYISGAIIVALIAYAGIFLMYPGVKEDEKMRSRLEVMEPKKEQKSFFQSLKFAFKQKNFIIYLIAYLCFQSFVLILMGSLPYYAPFVLKGSAEVESLLSIGFLVGSLVSIGLWTYLVGKYGNKSIFIVGFLFTGTILIPFLFLNNIIISFIIMILVGVGVGAIWIAIYPIYGDVIDEIVVKMEKREEAIFFGIRVFFARVSIIIQAITFALVHFMTGFNPEQSIQSPSALLGIRMQVALIPMLILYLGGLLFWRYYDLSSSRIEDIKLKLKELPL
jgi:Na+/melibiose symporter-like transporter